MKDHKKPIYYFNELEDDFGKKHIATNLYHGQVVIQRKGFYSLVSNLFFYLIAVPIVYCLMKLKGVKIRGKENIRKLKFEKKGFYIYSNHAGIFDTTIQYIISLPRRNETIGYSDAESNPGLRFIVPLLGYIPLPTDVHDMRKFNDAMKFYLEKNHTITIYPEAHIWPTYTKIRNFKRVSFRYPATFNVPILPVFYARRVRKGFWKLFSHPRITCLIGEPIYPDSSLSVKENAQQMGDKCYEALKALSESIPQEEYWKYVYRPTNAVEEEEMKGETK